MTRFKKSLALLLAIIMMFSSMSVAASATYGKDGIDNNDLRFQVVFYREDAKGNWVNATYDDPATPEKELIARAAPGDKIMARIYFETSFPAATGSLGFAFNDDYFTQL
ncbi:MAG: hypothetical protein IJ264_09510, partial [Clostridia bacterium]|nr:hypothetical protein [Clostridia bacterium]